MRIGLLKCDTVNRDLQYIDGDCSDMIVTLFSRHAPGMSIEIYDVEHGHYPDSIDECEGYISTGSRYSVYDDDAWIRKLRDFVAELYRNNVKFVGVCFGHQMIAQALDGECAKSERGWGLGVQTVKIVSKKDWMRPELDSYNLIVSHLDQVLKLPTSSGLLGVNDHCPHAMFMVGEHFLGIQGHPEFTAEYADALMLSRVDRIGRDAVEEKRKTLQTKSDSGIIATWIENFFRS